MRNFGFIPGMGKMSRFFLRKHLTPGVRVKDKFGVKFFANPGYFQDNLLLRTGNYEPEVLDCLIRSVKHLDREEVTFWDVGAGSGLHSLRLMKACSNVKAIAFEPSVTMLQYLHLNQRMNRLENMQSYQIALSDRTHLGNYFYMYGSNPGLSTIHETNNGEFQARKVMLFAGDDLVQHYGFNYPDVMKIDVEGATIQVLNGMRNILASANEMVLIMEVFEQEFHDVKELLSQFNYSKFTPIDRNHNYQFMRS